MDELKQLNWVISRTNNNSDKEHITREIVSIISKDSFDSLDKSRLIAEIHDTALRYLDKDLVSDKETNWQKLVELFSKI